MSIWARITCAGSSVGFAAFNIRLLCVLFQRSLEKLSEITPSNNVCEVTDEPLFLASCAKPLQLEARCMLQGKTAFLFSC